MMTTTYRPMFARSIVLVPTREQLTGSGLIYKGNSARGSKTQVKLACIVAQGPDTQESLPSGSIVLVQDDLEFIETNLDLWEELSGQSAFQELARYQQRTQCKVETKLLWENSFLAHWDDWDHTCSLVTGKVMAHLGQ